MKKIIILMCAGLLTVSMSAQSYKVIVNSSNSKSTLTKKEASDLFLKKTSKWDDGQKVTPIDQKGSSETRKGFTKDVHNKSVGAIKSYWQQYVFSGKGTPPVEKASDAEIIDFVKRNAGAIGYVSPDADIGGVKVIPVN